MAAYEEAALIETLNEVRDAAPALGGVRVFLVDDGGRTRIDPKALPARSPDFAIVLTRHVVNLGQGAALETARQLALREAPFFAYVTMDADGQHRARDVQRLVSALESGADVALGDRFAGRSAVPRARAVLLAAARTFERLLVGRALGDAHNGLRAFRRSALEQVGIRQNRMAHATEIVRLVLAEPRALRVVEVPVDIRYTATTLRKGQRSSGALTIASDLFHRYLFGAGES
jgi:hypothetical protein